MIDESAYADKTDAELVNLTLRDQDFFALLIRRYERRLLSYILRLTRVDYEEAEDILQNVFIKVYQNLRSYDPELKFSSWIYRISHNEVISHHRKSKARPEKALLDGDLNLVENLAADLDLAREVDNHFLRESIDRTLDALEEKYREILILRFFEEKDYREISDIIKKPMGTVASLVNRARKKFKEEYGELVKSVSR